MELIFNAYKIKISDNDFKKEPTQYVIDKTLLVTVNYNITVWILAGNDINFYIAAGLTHWGRVTHICVGTLAIIGSDNGLSPSRRPAIIWTNAGLLLIGPLGTNSSDILIGIQAFSFKKMHLEMSSAKWRPFCRGLNVLIKLHMPSLK